MSDEFSKKVAGQGSMFVLISAHALGFACVWAGTTDRMVEDWVREKRAKLTG